MPDAAVTIPGFDGDLILPSDPRYDESRTIWNAMIDRRPSHIARCHSVADVVAVVQWARAEGRELAVRGGGHSVPGHCIIEDGVVLDLSEYNAVTVDPTARTVRVQGGCLLGDVDRATQAYGLATPAGAISHTGAGGLILGGGFGWMMRKYGLTVDNLLGAEVVTADGDVLHVDDQNHPDLFWALRGGGGNFGVVTEFTLALHERGPVWLSVNAFELSDAPAVLRGMRDVMPTADDDLVWMAFFRMLPDWDWCPSNRVGDRVLLAPLAWLGEHSTGERVVRQMLADLPVRPLASTTGPIPFVELQSLNDELNGHGYFNYHKSSFLESLDDEVIDILVDRGGKIASANSQLEVLTMGGAIARVSPDATAFVHRSAMFPMNVCGIWHPDESTEANMQWVRSTFDALRPHFGDGSYLNFGGSDETRSAVEDGYGENWLRLREIKTRYDPTNFFRFNANIPPVQMAELSA
jgi:hypothetical protein